MLLKGDEGGAKFGGGAKDGDFRQRGHTPGTSLALRVTGMTSHALVSPDGGAGFAMLFSVAAAI
jgi:hypothetical protein